MTKDSTAVFCRALWRGEAETIAALAAQVDPNANDPWGNTPLLMAAQYGDLPLVSQLVARGGKIDQERRHLTPLTLAARRGAADIVHFLRARQATLSLFTWVHLGDLAEVQQGLAAAPEQVHLCDETGTPLLHHAVEALRPAVLSLLLERGARLDQTDAAGDSPLHHLADLRQAPQEPAAAVAALLLGRGADPNARNHDKVTPLHQAARARNLAVAKALLAAGADPNARDRRGSTPLRRAVATTGASGTAGTTALLVPLTRLLLACGADPDLADHRGVPVRASARLPALRALFEEHHRRPGSPAIPPTP